MNKYWFGVVLESSPYNFDDLSEQSFEAGCDDGTVSTRSGVMRIDFAREADSLDSAVRLAVKQIESIGCVIAKIEIDDVAMLREVA